MVAKKVKKTASAAKRTKKKIDPGAARAGKKRAAAKPCAKPAKAVAGKSAKPAKAAVRKGAASPASIRELLLREQAKIEKRLGMIQNDDSTAEAANVGDLADAASQDEARTVLRGLQQTEVEQLEQIKSALARIEAGTYGACVRCGCRIEEARLEALPHAPTCIVCRRREERGEFKGR